MILKLATLLLSLSVATSAIAQVDFRADVAPILVKRCLACHGEQKFKGGYQLHTIETLVGKGESGEAAVIGGKADGSLLLTLITSNDAAARMPKDADKLPDVEIDVIRRWIAGGAKLDGIDPKTPLVSLAQWKHPAPPDAYPQPFPITALAFRPDGKELAVGGFHEVTIWNPDDGTLARRIKNLAERTYSIAYSKDGSQLLVAAGTPGQMGEAKLLNATTGELKRHLGSFADVAFHATFSPDEKRIAVGGADTRVRVFDVTTGIEQTTIKDHSDWVHSVAWSPDGTKLATASRDKTCKVFDSQSGALVTTFTEHGNYVYGVAFHGDGKHAVSCGADGLIRHWIAGDPGWENPEKQDKKKKHQVTSLQGFTAPVHHLTLSGGLLFACSADLTARQFDLEKKSSVRTYAGHTEWPFAVAYHAESKRVATGGLDGRVRIWPNEPKDAKEFSFLAAPK